MTYCVALRLDRGLVFMSDTRTNAGVDNVASCRKMFSWSDGDCAVTLLTAGNLATTQAVVSLIEERLKSPGERSPSILGQPSMFAVARMVGDLLKQEIARAGSGQMSADAGTFAATLILGGQVRGSAPRLFLIYPEGNFIEAGDDMPWFQSGETKYGRPILVRAFDPAMSFEAAAKLLMVSYDSTIKANLSVGPPMDLQVYETDSLQTGKTLRIEANDPQYLAISEGWSDALRSAFDALPDVTL
ncbi:peptidase [Limimaricola pyoseonensis]|uniref:Putative proteasome-type protease n=1 Tax=Limimaricola pyoseonensis TaxID=521013 RepID=A0A1G7HLG2_9RHOB|nr:peptidase [Limimaricola pyoseonensis]SDF00839.1 putative proteasome-type protease [Limimaricola pyoseonensis]